MVSRDIRDQFSSELFNAFNNLRPESQPKRIGVFVESYQDVAFWYDLFHKYHDSNLSFDINPITNDGLKKGKSKLLEAYANRVGINMIVCLDSDYDYLLQQKTEFSQLINDNEYIFHTYIYAIENYFCLSETLYSVCVKAAKFTGERYDFESFFKQYSEIIYPLFLWSVYFYSIKEPDFFSIKEFNKILNFVEKVDFRSNYQEILIGLEERVNLKLTELETRYSSHINNKNEFEQELITLGIVPELTYLFVQGHHLLGNVNKLLTSYYSYLNKQQKDIIRNNCCSLDALALRKELDEYDNQTKSIDVCLKENSSYKQCFFYQKIESDITNYISKLRAS